MNEVFVPGAFYCPRCKFSSTLTYLDVKTGNMETNKRVNRKESCPNGCGLLWPVTWEKEAKDSYKVIENQLNEIRDIKTQLHESKIAEAYAIEEREKAYDLMEQARARTNELYALRGEDVVVKLICEKITKLLER